MSEMRDHNLSALLGISAVDSGDAFDQVATSASKIEDLPAPLATHSQAARTDDAGTAHENSEHRPTATTATSLVSLLRALPLIDAELETDELPGRSIEPLSNDVCQLREWGTDTVFSLDSTLFGLPTAAHAESSTALVIAAREDATRDPIGLRKTFIDHEAGIELVYDDKLWRLRDFRGLVGLKLDGNPVRETTLSAGAEITFGRKTYITESPRSIALRRFLRRLLGWSHDGVVAADRALRVIRVARSGRASLVLRGEGDLVPMAHTIHRNSLGWLPPFVVADPRRIDACATVRSPANCTSGMRALHQAQHGTLCMRARRLPADVAHVLSRVRHPESSVQLTVCAEHTRRSEADGFSLGATPIEIPPLSTRADEMFRIVRECLEDARDLLLAPSGCVGDEDAERIMQHGLISSEATFSDVERVAMRVVAIKVTQNMSVAARVLGMAPVSLTRWFRRRDHLSDRGQGDPSAES